MPAGSSVRSHSPGRAGGSCWGPRRLRRVSVSPQKWGLPERHRGPGFQTQSVRVSPQPGTLPEARRRPASRGTRQSGGPPSPHPRLCAQPRPAAPSPRAAPDAGLPPHPGCPSFCPACTPLRLSQACPLGTSGSPGPAWTDPVQGQTQGTQGKCGGQGQGRGGVGRPEAGGERCVSQSLVLSRRSSRWGKAINGLSSSFQESPITQPARQLPPPGCPPGWPRPSHLLPLQEGRCSPLCGHPGGGRCPSPALSPAPLPWAQWGAERGVIALGSQETAPGMESPPGTQPRGVPPTGHGTRTGGHPPAGSPHALVGPGPWAVEKRERFPVGGQEASVAQSRDPAGGPGQPHAGGPCPAGGQGRGR